MTPAPAATGERTVTGRRAALWLLTAAGALAWLLIDPPTPDLAAHEYRAELVDIAGYGIWEHGWYGGHHLPGYSVLFPLLAALLTPQFVAAGCAVIASWCFERLARGWWDDGAATAASAWFALGVVSTLVGGQLAFAAGLAPALAGLLAARDGRLTLAAALGALTTLTSPVVSAFLALACTAWWLGGASVAGRASSARPAIALAGGAIVPGLLIAFAFPQGGMQPFAFSSFFWSFVVAVALAAGLPARERVLRIGAGLYGAALVAAIVIDTPLGGNLVRLAAVFGGPVAAGALWERRRQAALVALAVPLLYWQWLAPVRSVIRGAGDPSSERAYHQPLIDELARRSRAEGPFRAEIPFTANHWETRFVAPRQPLARGWERQLDVKLNALFYDDKPLTALRYRRWLDQLAVRYVALPGIKLDPSGQEEGDLVREGRVAGLREVWRGGDWRLYRLDDARQLASTPARVTSIGVDEVGLVTPRAATVEVRVRYTPYWAITSGRGCVSEAPGGWTRVQLDSAGSARLAVRFSLKRIRARGARCRG